MNFPNSRQVNDATSFIARRATGRLHRRFALRYRESAFTSETGPSGSATQTGNFDQTPDIDHHLPHLHYSFASIFAFRSANGL
jgi:hypothetical protein